MKILYVTPRFPYPPIKGDQAVVYNRLRLLGQRHEITLVSLYENDDELVGLTHLKEYCSSVHTIKLPKWKSIMNIVSRALISGLPLQVLYYHSTEFRQCLKKILQEQKFDLIHAYLIRVAECFEEVATPKVLDLIDSMQLNLQRRLCLEHIPRSWLFAEEFRRIRIYERKVGKMFDHMILVSERDKELIPDKNVSVIPLGVNIDIFIPQEAVEKKYTLIFSGNMAYAPNIHAVKWFMEKSLPIIQKVMPNVTFVIAGGNPSQELKNIGRQKGIIVTGFVDSMPDMLNQACIAIAPMQSGSGMQFKILEAMSCGLPVVTNTMGIGNINARHGEEIFVADGEENFATAILYLLTNTQLAKKIGQQARKYVIEHHSWEHAAEKVEAIYCDILKS